MVVMLVLLFIAHLLGDFIFQPASLAEKKKTKLSLLFLHSIIYAACILAILLLSLDINTVWLFFIILIVSHFIIDFVRIKCFKTKENEYRKEFYLFVSDQILHIIIIILAFYLFEIPSHIGSGMKSCVDNFSYSLIKKVVLISFVYIIALNPTAVLVKKVLDSIVNGKVLDSDEKNGNKEDRDEGIDKSGYLIGIFERLIVITFILMNQFGAIGFVLAAKSLARFKQLEKKGFAEKYLVGTLLSITVALCSTLLIKMFI